MSVAVAAAVGVASCGVKSRANILLPSLRSKHPLRSQWARTMGRRREGEREAVGVGAAGILDANGNDGCGYEGREGAGNAPLTAKKPRSVAAAVPAPDFKGQTSSFLPTED